METTGVLIADPTCTTYNGKNKWDFVLEIPGKYPVKIAFTAWGDKGDALTTCTAGQELTVKANVESREYNGKWYTDVKAWSIKAAETGATNGGSKPLANGAGLPEKASVLQAFAPTEEENFDLPF